MNFELKNIESFIPDSDLEAASELMQKDLVRTIRSLEKNLWTAQVSETFEDLEQKIFFEVEVKLTGKKVKACTCECDFFQSNKKAKNNFCKHIITTLFAL